MNRPSLCVYILSGIWLLCSIQPFGSLAADLPGVEKYLDISSLSSTANIQDVSLATVNNTFKLAIGTDNVFRYTVREIPDGKGIMLKIQVVPARNLFGALPEFSSDVVEALRVTVEEKKNVVDIVLRMKVTECKYHIRQVRNRLSLVIEGVDPGGS